MWNSSASPTDLHWCRRSNNIIVDVCLPVVFLWLHSPAAAGNIFPFEVLVEPHGRVVLLFAGQRCPLPRRLLQLLRFRAGCLVGIAVGLLVPKMPI